MRLLIFDTHPIQYRSPVFRALAEKGTDFKVYFFNDRFDSTRWWFHEIGKTHRQNFDVPMQDGFQNSTLGTRRLGLFKTWKALKRILSEERPSEVALYGYYEPEHWMLRILCAWHDVPLIFVGETFTSGPWSFRRLIKTPLRAFFFAGVRKFIAIGEKTMRYYRELGVSESRLIGARYCIDFSFFDQTDEQAKETRHRWRLRWKLPEDAFVVLFVGRLFERKRPEDMITLHRQLSRFEKVHTVMVGNGPLEAALKEQTRDLPRLLWTGFQNQACTRDAYYGADLLVVPSEYETWGLVVNEAAACALPAAVSDTCGVAGDLTLNGVTGLVFPKGNIDILTLKVASLIDNEETRVDLGLSARVRVKDEFGVGQFADAFVQAMGSVS